MPEVNVTADADDDPPIRPAATVIIARQAEPQYEIFMLRRTSDAAFAGGMYVFPGGRVDDHDGSAEYQGLFTGPTAHQAGQQAALGDDWQKYWLTGIRETFEESGFMLAYDSDGKVFAYDEESDARFDHYRKALHGGELTLADICARENLTLAIDLIHFFNRWITPPGRPRRFDTRFFITEAPPSQTGVHDGHETVDSLWISPADALEKHAKKELGLMRVTERQLNTFNRYRRLEDFITMAKNNEDFPTYRPTTPAN